MYYSQSSLSLVAAVAFASCAPAPVATNAGSIPLQEDFQRASVVMQKFSVTEMNVLRERLHQRMRQEGDEKFATELAKQPESVQIDVVNVMGFLNPTEYDEFPRTKYVLSAAPKI